MNHKPDPRLKHSVPKDIHVLMQDLMDYHRIVAEVMGILTDQIRRGQITGADLVDAGYLCREISDLFDELRKETKARCELSGKVLAAQFMQDSLVNPTADDVVRGNISRAKVDMVMEATVPKEGSKEYEDFCNFIGLGTAARAYAKPSWSKVSDLVTTLASEGRPLPPGIGKSWPRYTAVFTKV